MLGTWKSCLCLSLELNRPVVTSKGRTSLLHGLTTIETISKDKRTVCEPNIPRLATILDSLQNSMKNQLHGNFKLSGTRYLENPMHGRKGD